MAVILKKFFKPLQNEEDLIKKHCLVKVVFMLTKVLLWHKIITFTLRWCFQTTFTGQGQSIGGVESKCW